MSTGLPAASFWRGRRVLVTGHTGFKGGWLMALLDRLGATAAGYALPPATEPSLFAAIDVAALGGSTFGDVCDTAAVNAAMTAFAPDVVLHLAAQALVRPAHARPVETFATNVMGTAQVLEAVRQTPSVRSVIVVTSDKVYDNAEWAWAYRESDRLGGKEAYGASKAAAEIVVQAYAYSYLDGRKHPARVATARAGNVIGGGDWAVDRVVPDAMRAFAAGAPLVIRNPAAVRPWQHVLEPLAGYLVLAERIATGGALPEHGGINFGPVSEDAVPVSAIADHCVRLWGGEARWEQDRGSHPYEARLLEVDSALARQTLGWKPRWRLETALGHTVRWYKAFYGAEDARAVTRAQIDEYLDG